MQSSAAMLRSVPAECSHSQPLGQLPPLAHRHRQGKHESSVRCRSSQDSNPWGGFGMGPTCPNMNDPRVREMAQQWEQAARAYSQQGQAWQPRPTSDMLLSVDMVESADNYTFYADVPGLQKQDLSIRINQQERRLTLSGERTEPEVTGPGSEADNRKRYERPHGKFSRSVQLPADADPKGVTARVDQGVLTLVMHKQRPRFEDVVID